MKTRAEKQRDMQVTRRNASRDKTVGKSGKDKSSRIDLGLEIFFSFHRQPGVRYTRQVLASFCGCTDGAIYAIEKKALAKLRAAWRRRGETCAGDAARAPRPLSARAISRRAA